MVSLQQGVVSSGVEDLDEDASSGSRSRLSHDVFDVFFNCLFRDEEGVGYFFVGPPLSQIFHNGLLSIGQLKFLSGMVGIEILSSPKLFHRDNKACVLDPATIRKAKPTKEDGLVGISTYTFKLKLLPVFCFSANVECLDDFSAEFGESRW